MKAGVRDGCGDLSSDQIEEAVVVVIEYTAGTDTGDQEGKRQILAWLRDRQHQRSIWRLGPESSCDRAKARREIVDRLGLASASNLGQRPDSWLCRS